MRTLFLLAVGMACTATVGCGERTVSVSGKVTFAGKPVVFGTVVLVGSDGVPKNGAIQPDGSFTVSGVKPGTVKVAVSSPPPPGSNVKSSPRGGREGDDERKPADAGAAVNPDVVKNWFPLQDKFGYPDQSGCTVEVVAGKPVEIVLK